MFKRGLLNIVLVVLLVLTALTLIYADESVHWGYEGEEGPDNWGELSEEFAVCGEGTAQSPVDITAATEVDLSDISVNYGETALNILNNGHTIQVNADAGSSIVYNEITYDLLQFHFHNPSEHLIESEAAPMEIHFVHASANGNLAVIGVMLMEGDRSEAYAGVFDNLPAEETEATAIEGVTVDLGALLPEDAGFYTYNGSLTTPPCTEIVRWLVMTDPVTLSAEQIAAFGAIYEGNARPVQPLNDRDLFTDASE